MSVVAGDFFEDARKALIGVGILEYDKKTPRTHWPPCKISKFLNRSANNACMRRNAVGPVTVLGLLV